MEDIDEIDEIISIQNQDKRKKRILYGVIGIGILSFAIFLFHYNGISISINVNDNKHKLNDHTIINEPTHINETTKNNVQSLTEEEHDKHLSKMKPKFNIDYEILTNVNLEQLFNRCKNENNIPSYIWVRMMKTATTSQYTLFKESLNKYKCYSSMAIPFLHENFKELDRILKNFNLHDKKRFDCHPKFEQHVAYNKSFIDKYVNKNAIKITGFRSPIRRAMSSILYRMDWGPDDVDRYVYVKSCFRKAKRYTTVKEYMLNCKEVLDDYYLRMLDPDTKQVDVAINRLKDFFIFNVDDHAVSWDILRRLLCLDPSDKEKTKNAATSQDIDKIELDYEDMIDLVKFTSKDDIIYEHAMVLYKQLRIQYFDYIKKYP